LEERAIEEIIFITLKYVRITFSTYLGITEVRHHSPNICGVVPHPQDKMPHPLPLAEPYEDHGGSGV